MIVSSSKTALLLAAAVAAGLAGCNRAPEGAAYNDPFEAQNRAVHAANVELDSALLRPTSKAYSIVPKPVQQAVANFSDNFETPGMMVNSLLQGDVEALVGHTFRFVINSTVGLGGLLDPADAIGITAADKDFGQTLQVWGVGEGAYQELPFYGPSTERDTAGLIVDFVLNPLGYIIPSPQRRIGTLTKLASKIGDRARYSDTVDSLLYESADGYAQARQIYLENRRFELGETMPGDTFDPYEDPYAP